MSKKQKLELTWIGKNQQPQLEPRILIEDPARSYGDKKTGNMLIHGDNLLALKALEQDFSGKVRCVYIDPPYNTGSAFEHYDDGVEHSIWLSLMRDRLTCLKRLLSDDGSIWVQLDDNEVHYCRVIMDEIMERRNFVATVVWQKVFAKKNKALISGSHDTILVYAKNINKWRRNLLGRSEDQKKAFRNPDGDPRGLWQSVSYSVQSEDAERRAAYRYTIPKPAGGEAFPPQGRHWNGLPDRTEQLIAENRLWFGPKGDRAPRIKAFLSEVQKGIVPDSWWTHKECGNNQEAKKEQLAIIPDAEPFNTPKPERLISRVLEIATDPGDVVLDSFLGSGTTTAVAHKMGRRWIGIELGEHCETHCLPRLKQVCDGTDQGGISEAGEWNGGSGFNYYELAPSLLKQDPHENWVISEEYNANMLAAAMAKHESFKYCPDSETYWKQGQSSEKDFIFTTTSFVQVAFIDKIHEEMQEDEHLLICCRKFSAACSNRYPSIEIKKIPKMLLGKCEFGREDYSLNIVNMPVDEDEPEFVPPGPPKPKLKKGRANPAQPDLFGVEPDREQRSGREGGE